MEIINGKKIAKEIKSDLAKEVEQLKRLGVNPALTVILVGNDSASEIYVRSKAKACAEIGISSNILRLSKKIEQKELINLISRINQDAKIHGLLVQLPLPDHLDEDVVVQSVALEKDVDCFCAENVGRMFFGKGEILSCTPAGVVELLRRSGVGIAGKDVVIIGRSRVVGRPLAAMLINLNATVTVCHKQTKNLSEKCAQADILISAAGQAGLVTEEMIKPGAVVIDVGINRTKEGKVVGDVVWSAAERRASLATPVPGGVGPMTIAMLLKNTIIAANIAAKKLNKKQVTK